MSLAKNDTGKTLGHELGHAIDGLFEGEGHDGANWGRFKSRFVSKEDGGNFRGWFKKQHSGKIGTYKNGDGDFFRDNWISDYEGRIYRGRGTGQEWWAMNCERYSDYKYKLDSGHQQMEVPTCAHFFISSRVSCSVLIRIHDSAAFAATSNINRITTMFTLKC